MGTLTYAESRLADLKDRLQQAIDGRCMVTCASCEFAIDRARQEVSQAQAVVDEEKLALLRLRQKGLRFANGVRYFLNLPPIGDLRPGDIGVAASCPITNTVLDGDSGIEVETQRKRITVTRGTEVVFASRIPAEVQGFISAFDSGQFPDLKSAPKMDQV